jgi:hypothetical protein
VHFSNYRAPRISNRLSGASVVSNSFGGNTSLEGSDWSVKTPLSPISRSERKRYWGDSGRKKLFETFAQVNRSNREFSKQFPLSPVTSKSSPFSFEDNRSNNIPVYSPKNTAAIDIFISYCQENSFQPLPIIIRKLAEDEGTATELDLKRKGIGDKFCIPVAQCLTALPNVLHLNLQDNRLSHLSLCPLLDKVCLIDIKMSIFTCKQKITINNLKTFRYQTAIEYSL